MIYYVLSVPLLIWLAYLVWHIYKTRKVDLAVPDDASDMEMESKVGDAAQVFQEELQAKLHELHSYLSKQASEVKLLEMSTTKQRQSKSSTKTKKISKSQTSSK